MIIEIDFRSEVPPARQIADAVTLRALTGALAPGSPLPEAARAAGGLLRGPHREPGAERGGGVRAVTAL
ncbi:MAG: hypothetical protein U9R79_00550 [Armatimonadota bacterium]|nr:hypothetical protein [Armatimonadota bacterium]